MFDSRNGFVTGVSIEKLFNAFIFPYSITRLRSISGVKRLPGCQLLPSNYLPIVRKFAIDYSILTFIPQWEHVYSIPGYMFLRQSPLLQQRDIYEISKEIYISGCERNMDAGGKRGTSLCEGRRSFEIWG